MFLLRGAYDQQSLGTTDLEAGSHQPGFLDLGSPMSGVEGLT